MPDENPAQPPARETGRSTGRSLQVLMDARVRPALEKAGAFYSARNLREKTMLVVFAAVLVLFLDYWTLVRPVILVFTETMPKLATLDVELDGLRHDKKNAVVIEKEWEEMSRRTVEREGAFITRDRVPELLENLSKLASDSGVKILSLKPVASPPPDRKAPKKAAAPKSAGGYSLVMIRLNAIAGTHEFGRFLAKVESSPTFFRVKDVHVTAQGEADIRRHLIEVNIETYSRSELNPVKK